MKSKTLALALLCAFTTAQAVAEKEHAAQGMVIVVDAAKRSVVISCEAIPGYMDAMEMPFKVQDATVLQGLAPGMHVRFVMVEQASEDFAEHIEPVKQLNGEAEPIEAGRLSVLQRALNPAAAKKVVAIGQQVPDFALIDQAQHSIHLAQFKGKVVALTFAYSRCPNPNYCFRLSNNLAQVGRRFAGHGGKDLALITIVIDPANDQGTALATYARTWKADAAQWHFLTGSLETVQQVAGLFGMSFWNDEGFLTHSFHTVVIDRDGRLAANLEGNQFSARQLGDLVGNELHPVAWKDEAEQH